MVLSIVVLIALFAGFLFVIRQTPDHVLERFDQGCVPALIGIIVVLFAIGWGVQRARTWSDTRAARAEFMTECVKRSSNLLRPSDAEIACDEEWTKKRDDARVSKQYDLK